VNDEHMRERLAALLQKAGCPEPVAEAVPVTTVSGTVLVLLIIIENLIDRVTELEKR